MKGSIIYVCLVLALCSSAWGSASFDQVHLAASGVKGKMLKGTNRNFLTS